MEKTFLDYIMQRSNELSVKWANGVIGSISDRKSSLTYRFHREDNIDKEIIDKVVLQDDEDAPIVAVGIVAYWLYYRKNPNCVSKFGIDRVQKNIPKIFADYTKDMWVAYEMEQTQKASSWRGVSELEFITNCLIPEEKSRIKQSEALFEYISQNDQQLVREIMTEYIEYLEDYRAKILTQKDDEIVKQLVPYFYSEQYAKRYLDQIRGLKDTEIAIITNKYWAVGTISEEATPTAIWRVLHDNGIYTSTDTNFRAQVKFKREEEK